MGGWWVLMEGAGGTRAKRVMALFGTMSIDVIGGGATQQAAGVTRCLFLAARWYL